MKTYEQQIRLPYGIGTRVFFIDGDKVYAGDVFSYGYYEDGLHVSIKKYRPYPTARDEFVHASAEAIGRTIFESNTEAIRALADRLNRKAKKQAARQKRLAAEKKRLKKAERAIVEWQAEYECLERTFEDLRKDYDALEKRMQHLCSSKFIASFDEVDPRTGQYVRDIQDADKFGYAYDRILKHFGDGEKG